MHQLGTVLGGSRSAFLLPLPEHIQILRGGLSQRLIIPGVRLIAIPFDFAVIGQDAGTYLFLKIGVYGNGFFAPDILPEFSFSSSYSIQSLLEFGIAELSP